MNANPAIIEFLIGVVFSAANIGIQIAISNRSSGHDELDLLEQKLGNAEMRANNAEVAKTVCEERLQAQLGTSAKKFDNLKSKYDSLYWDWITLMRGESNKGVSHPRPEDLQ